MAQKYQHCPLSWCRKRMRRLRVDGDEWAYKCPGCGNEFTIDMNRNLLVAATTWP